VPEGRAGAGDSVNAKYGHYMGIYVFVSESDPDLLGFTSDESGANLPNGHGPWHEEVEPDDPIALAVWRYGFSICAG
jgi:hypothetical protein